MTSALRSIVDEHRPDPGPIEDFYRHLHRNPELSGLESETAALVASRLRALGLEVHTHIGGHGVAAVLRNGPGRTVLVRAELDALPIREETGLPYASTRHMIDRYGRDRPAMHACGHDVNMACVLGAATLLAAAVDRWSGTLLVVFQPDEEETGGAAAMVAGGLYSRVPFPDVMLAQHVTPYRSGIVGVPHGPALCTADSVEVRVVGGPVAGANPQNGVDPIGLAMDIIRGLPGAVERAAEADSPRDAAARGAEHGNPPREVATVACWGFHAGIPGNDYVAYADFLLDVKTVKPDVRRRVLAAVERHVRDACTAAGTPRDPEIKFIVRAPPTRNSASVADPVRRVFRDHFGSGAIDIEFRRACEDFSLLGRGDGAGREGADGAGEAVGDGSNGNDGPRNVPYAYWFYGGSSAGPEGEEQVPTNHSPFFAPAIQPTLKTGTDAMALAALTFLAV